MRIIEKAPLRDFDVYVARADTVWCEREQDDTLESLYEKGYLPYSGARGVHGIFYTARSARIALPAFALSSENRRIARKFDGQFSKKCAADFKPDEAFYEFCVAYFAEKHGPRAMPRERLETIFNSGLITSVIQYFNDTKVVAYVLEVAEGSTGHYWFSFYDLAYARQSLGLWLMLDCIREAKARGLDHYYLGTVYGQHALYKTNFSPLQWWSGESWSGDIRLLKEQL